MEVQLTKRADILVVGAGHAGCEAALAAARLGMDTILVTTNLNQVAKTPCNPAIGGPGKTQLVMEIDALGGEMAKNTDKAMINVRQLNTSKGPAVRVIRAQVDRDRYKQEMRKTLERQESLTLVEGLVEGLSWERGKVIGAITRERTYYEAQAVILTTGTFLNGKIYIGDRSYSAGRSGEPPAVGLSNSLRKMGFQLIRLNTGTTPRVNRDSIHLSKLTKQDTSDEPLAFSYTSEQRVLPKEWPVYITRTTDKTHRIVRENLDRNPSQNGTLKGVSPRYCPSIEVKILKFSDRKSHKVFIEPEGRDTEEIYLQGVYTCAPPDIQEAMVRSIPGLEEAVIERYGYYIEYDAVIPTQLKPSLETKRIEGLFFAGQINGTTGYEEAAAQGIIAGINATRKLQGKEPLLLRRSLAFIGVLIDDLVTKGVDEPYRMLTSRSEYRLIQRANNADLRLTELGHQIGLISAERYRRFRRKKELIEQEVERLKVTKLPPEAFASCKSLYDLLKRPEFSYADLESVDGGGATYRDHLPPEVICEVEIRAKYEGYIKRQLEQAERFKRMEDKRIPADLDYSKIKNLSSEGREKLERVRPITLSQASRIPGISRADLSILMVRVRKRG